MRKNRSYPLFLSAALSVSALPATNAAADESLFTPMTLRDAAGIFDFGIRPNIIDVTNDGRPDLIFVRRESGQRLDQELIFLENEGDKVPFGKRLVFAPDSRIAYDQGEVVSSHNSSINVKVADLNNDSLPDILIARAGSVIGQNEISVAYNTGSSPRFATPIVIGISAEPVIDDLADMDGDNDLDLIADGALITNLGSPTGFGPLSEAVTIPPVAIFGDGAIGDIDGDGDVDFVSSTPGGGGFAMLNNGTAQPFRNVDPVTITNHSPNGTAGSTLADLNNDGRLDLIRTSFGEVAWFLNNGRPSLFNREPVILTALPNVGACEVTLAKINNDDFLDLLAECDALATLFVNSGTNVPFAGNDPGVETLLFQTGSVSGDIDGDGDTDLIGPNLTMYLNNRFTNIPMPVLSYPETISVAEDAGSVDINFRLNRPQTTPVTLEFATVPSRSSQRSATPGQDFYGVFQPITFSPGETEKAVRISILDDDLIESDEIFYGLVSFFNGANVPMSRDGVLIEQQQVQVTIQDDDEDGVALLKVSDARTVESNGRLRFSVELERPSSQTVSVSLATIRGSGNATQGVDYYGKYEVIEFEPGQLRKYFDVDVLYDFIDEGVETFDVNVFNVVNAEYSGAPVTGTISDDSTATATILEPRSISVEEGRRIDFNVQLDRPMAQVTTVRLTTRNLTATPGQDYFGTYTLVTFNPGEVKKIATVTTLDDTATEDTENFGVRLINPSGGIRVPNGTNDETVVNILDND